MSKSRVIEYDEDGNEVDPENIEKLFWPVDDGDIYNGSRDAIELKPARSNEDAFFLVPENNKTLACILFI